MKTPQETILKLTVNRAKPKATYPPQIAVAAAANARTRIARRTLAQPTAVDQRGMGTTCVQLSVAVDILSEVDVENREIWRNGSSSVF